jgi:uncharacterized repeat protein (TIGR01451 family)
MLALLPLAAQASDPQIASLVDNPDPVAAGGLYTYTLRIDNNAVDAALNTRLTFTVPSGAAFVSASPASQNCVASSAVAPVNVTCTLGTLGALGADVRTVIFTMRAVVPGPAVIAANAVISASNEPAASLGNNTQDARTTVIEGANLALTKTASPARAIAGGPVTYTLTANNAGPNPGGDMVITDNLPPSVTFVSASGSGWTCSNAAGTVTCRRPGPLAVGETAPPVTLVGTVNAAGGTVTNSASVAPATGGVADPVSSDNTATVDTPIDPGANLSITKSVTSAQPATAGQPVTFVLRPLNAGPATATNAVVTDTLPAGWTFVSATGTNWTCSNAGQAVTCSRPSLSTTAADTITVVATAPANAAVAAGGSSYTNTATIASDVSDPVPGNNTGTAPIQVRRDGADLALSKSKTPNPVALGSNMVSTIIVSNGGPRRATGPLRVVESLNGEVFVSATGAGWVCTPSGSVVVCEHPNTGGLAASGTLPTLSLTTQATVAGNASNEACTGSSLPANPGSATASPPAEGDPNPGNDCATVTARSTTVRPDLAIAKVTSTADGDKVLNTNESSVRYTLTVRNASPGSDGATGVLINDTVPGFIAGRTTFGAITAVASAGSSAVLVCSTSGASVVCRQTAGTLAKDETVQVTINVNRPLSDNNGLVLTNTATVSNTAEGDPNSGNNTASDTVTIEPIADVEMTGKTVTPTSVRAGQNATYVLSFRNNGPSSAAAVKVSDVFNFGAGDTGLTVVSVTSTASGSSCTQVVGGATRPLAAGSTITPDNPAYSCAIGTMTNNQTQSITLVVRPNFMAGNPARTLTNQVRITTTSVENPDGTDNNNNTKTATLAITPAQLNLLVNKTDVVDPVPYYDAGAGPSGGTFLDYVVRVSNTGPSYGTGVRFTESMTPPAGKTIRFVGDMAAAGGAVRNAPPLCSVANVESAPGAALPTFTCDVPAGDATTGLARGDLAAGQSKSVFLRFAVVTQPEPTGDVFNNVVTVSANEPDTDLSNNTESEATTTRQRVDLRVTKTSSAAAVALNEPFVWTIGVENRGPGNSLRTDLTDTLPAGVSLTGTVTFTRTAPAGSGTCTVSGQVISCALGQLNALGTATISVPVRFTSFPTGGTGTNTATVDTDPAKTGGIDVPGNNNTAASPVTVNRASLSGTVFEDRDRIGANAGTPQAAAGEPRIAGVTITLTGTDAFGNPVSLTTTTGADGSYSFPSLPPSDGTGYTITETQPAGFVNGPAAPPSSGAGAPSAAGAYAAGGAAGNSSHSGVVLAAATQATNYNFPEVRRPSLSGFVYVDVNGNDSRDAGSDTPIRGATVRLLNAATGDVVATATTDDGGAYIFRNLDPLLSYTLEEPLPTTPANLANGPVNPGLVNGVACGGCAAARDSPSAGTDRITAIDLSSGTDGTQFNFGERQVTAITGLVYVDANRNNGLDGSDSGRIPGVTIRLVQGADCASGTTLQTTTTGADGSYRFDGVVVGAAYLLCETQPAGYGNGNANGSGGSDVIRIAALPAGGSANNLFGETLASLAGTVYQDNGTGVPGQADNGIKDSGEPGIPNVPVTLTGTDVLGNPVTRTTTTDANGNWLFDGLLPPNAAGYTVTEGAIPAASGRFTDGRETVGSAGGSAAVNDQFSGIALAAGTQASGYLFGELGVASVSGLVHIDANRNNALDGGDTGRIPGVTIRLVQGADCASGTTVQTTTTGADGSFRFDNVAIGQAYLVCETQPAGYGNGHANGSAGSNTISIGTLGAAGSSGNVFGETLASLAGTVYQDNGTGVPSQADNGAKDSGEAGIPNVPVTLTGTDVLGNPVTRTTTTDANGNWLFDGLLPPNAAGYTVTEGAIPAASGRFLDGRETVGTAGGSAAVNDQFSGIALGAGTQATGYLFGELGIAPISGTVYVDLNRNGQIDPSPTDGRVPGVTLTLVQGSSCSGPVIATTTTDASGNYSFSGAAVGMTYTVCETQPAGYLTGGENPGTNGSSATPNAITIANLPAAGSPGNHFGEIASNSVITGKVWLDGNNSAMVDGGEAGIAGVTITLTGTDIAGNPVTRTTTTDANGDYRFDALPPGTYNVTEPAQPAGTLNGRTVAGSGGGTVTTPGVAPSAIRGIVLGLSQTASGNNFGEIAPARVAGTVYGDNNNNGRQDGGEAGLPGVAITLTGTDDNGVAVSLTTTTAADGSYSFDNLRPGSYSLTEPTQPAGTFNGITSPGTAGGTATGPAVAPSAIGGITLAAGTAALANNFGEIPPARVAGTVYADNNNNGTLDSGEGGLGGVTVTLTGTDDTGAAVSLSTTTGSDGGYAFSNLRPGTYTLTEPTQPAGTVNGITSPGTLGGTATTPASSPSAITGIVLPAGGAALANNFGEIGQSPDLKVSKSHSPARLTVNNAATVTVAVRNAGQLASNGTYTVSDRLPTGLTLAAVPTGTGWVCTGAAGDSRFSCTSSAVLAVGASAPAINAPVKVGAAALAASPLQNAVMVEGGGELPARAPTDADRAAFNGNPDALPVCDPAVIHEVCRDPAVVQASASVAGTAWYDSGSSARVLDAGDRRLPGWRVEVVDAAGTVVGTATTAADGTWQIADLVPGVPLQVRYRNPDTGVVFGYPVNGDTGPGTSGASCDAAAASKGTASSCAHTTGQPVLDIVSPRASCCRSRACRWASTRAACSTTPARARRSAAAR